MNTRTGTSASMTKHPRTPRPGTKFRYGDFTRVHRCGVLAAESRAGRNHERDIEDATIQLPDLMDERKH
jgi:hypothetical protein